ncbi:peptidylprolyl isomerase [Rossellomorea marisflavi]|uniref:peptidylprolyl isomerase n=1 Tax=Rossellomorea marisflavi TaxID=189381 RepID=UPI0034599C73
MKKWILSVSLVAGAVGLAGCSGIGADDKDVVATTKAGDITKDELYDSAKQKFTPQMEQALQELVYTKVLDEKYDVSKDEINKKMDEAKEQLGDQFDMFLQQYNLDEKSFKEYLKLQLLQEKAATADIKVTDKELKDYYEKWKAPIEVRHILVEDEKTAKEVKKKLADGGKFEDLASEYSTDTASAANGGSLGWVDNAGRQSFVPEFSKALDSLKKGEVSEPVKTDYGYHIIEVTDTKEKKPFKDMKKDLEQELKLSKVDQSKIQESMKDEIEKADLKIKDKDLKDAFEQVLNGTPAPDAAAPEGNATTDSDTKE